MRPHAGQGRAWCWWRTDKNKWLSEVEEGSGCGWGRGSRGGPPVGHSLPPAPKAALLFLDLSKLLPLLGLCTCCPSTWKSPQVWPVGLLLVLCLSPARP